MIGNQLAKMNVDLAEISAQSYHHADLSGHGQPNTRVKYHLAPRPPQTKALGPLKGSNATSESNRNSLRGKISSNNSTELIDGIKGTSTKRGSVELGHPNVFAYQMPQPTRPNVLSNQTQYGHEQQMAPAYVESYAQSLTHETGKITTSRERRGTQYFQSPEQHPSNIILPNANFLGPRRESDDLLKDSHFVKVVLDDFRKQVKGLEDQVDAQDKSSVGSNGQGKQSPRRSQGQLRDEERASRVGPTSSGYDFSQNSMKRHIVVRQGNHDTYHKRANARLNHSVEQQSTRDFYGSLDQTLKVSNSHIEELKRRIQRRQKGLRSEDMNYLTHLDPNMAATAPHSLRRDKRLQTEGGSRVNSMKQKMERRQQANFQNHFMRSFCQNPRNQSLFSHFVGRFGQNMNRQGAEQKLQSKNMARQQEVSYLGQGPGGQITVIQCDAHVLSSLRLSNEKGTMTLNPRLSQHSRDDSSQDVTVHNESVESTVNVNASTDRKDFLTEARSKHSRLNPKGSNAFGTSNQTSSTVQNSTILKARLQSNLRNSHDSKHSTTAKKKNKKGVTPTSFDQQFNPFTDGARASLPVEGKAIGAKEILTINGGERDVEVVRAGQVSVQQIAPAEGSACSSKDGREARPPPSRETVQTSLTFQGCSATSARKNQPLELIQGGSNVVMYHTIEMNQRMRNEEGSKLLTGSQLSGQQSTREQVSPTVNVQINFKSPSIRESSVHETSLQPGSIENEGSSNRVKTYMANVYFKSNASPKSRRTRSPQSKKRKGRSQAVHGAVASSQASAYHSKCSMGSATPKSTRQMQPCTCDGKACCTLDVKSRIEQCLCIMHSSKYSIQAKQKLVSDDYIETIKNQQLLKQRQLEKLPLRKGSIIDKNEILLEKPKQMTSHAPHRKKTFDPWVLHRAQPSTAGVSHRKSRHTVAKSLQSVANSSTDQKISVIQNLNEAKMPTFPTDESSLGNKSGLALAQQHQAAQLMLTQQYCSAGQVPHVQPGHIESKQVGSAVFQSIKDLSGDQYRRYVGSEETLPTHFMQIIQEARSSAEERQLQRHLASQHKEGSLKKSLDVTDTSVMSSLLQSKLNTMGGISIEDSVNLLSLNKVDGVASPGLSVKKQLRLQKMALQGASYKPKFKIFEQNDIKEYFRESQARYEVSNSLRGSSQLKTTQSPLRDDDGQDSAMTDHLLPPGVAPTRGGQSTMRGKVEVPAMSLEYDIYDDIKIKLSGESNNVDLVTINNSQVKIDEAADYLEMMDQNLSQIRKGAVSFRNSAAHNEHDELIQKDSIESKLKSSEFAPNASIRTSVAPSHTKETEEWMRESDQRKLQLSKRLIKKYTAEPVQSIESTKERNNRAMMRRIEKKIQTMNARRESLNKVAQEYLRRQQQQEQNNQHSRRRSLYDNSALKKANTTKHSRFDDRSRIFDRGMPMLRQHTLRDSQFKSIQEETSANEMKGMTSSQRPQNSRAAESLEHSPMFKPSEIDEAKIMTTQAGRSRFYKIHSKRGISKNQEPSQNQRGDFYLAVSKFYAGAGDDSCRTQRTRRAKDKVGHLTDRVPPHSFPEHQSFSKRTVEYEVRLESQGTLTNKMSQKIYQEHKDQSEGGGNAETLHKENSGIDFLSSPLGQNARSSADQFEHIQTQTLPDDPSKVSEENPADAASHS